MSTRRARIKAVTSLPPRRKNVDSVDSVKSKVQAKDEAEKAIKSPRTPRGTKIQEVSEKNSPARKLSSPVESLRILSNTPKAHTTEQDLSLPTGVTKESAAVVPKISEKVSVITNTSNNNDSNVFRSPKSVGSPFRRSIVSPLVHTKVDIDLKRLETPEKHDKSKQITTKSNIVNEHKSNIGNTSSAVNEVGNDVPDDYNVPSVPESIPEDAVMDGIVPLQPVASAPKPIALLKNEIISENAEVLFDPIVPLPSPSKVRPKLRPVPRLAPLRRNSVQGSASESEDESRRALLNSAVGAPPLRQRHDSHTSHSTLHSLHNREVNRVRNDSVCSSVSQPTAQPPVAASPHKEKHFTKSRRAGGGHEAPRRAAALRRRRDPAPRDALTMYDLIFYNPTANPIIPDQDEINLKAANAKEEKARVDAKEVDDDNPDDPTDDAAPVPQIKLGPNGEIMLDEQSLVIKHSGKRKVSDGVVHEGGWSGGGGGAGRYRRTARTAEWSDAETVRFYRALAALGTDFMLMEPLFPGRARRDLKLKFKKEERVNAAQVDKALRTSSKWDAVRLIDEFREEREAAERRARDDSERLKRGARDQRDRARAARELRVRQSRGSKALESSILPGHRKEDIGLTADEIIRRHTLTKADQKKRKLPVPEATPGTLVNVAPKPQFATLTLINNTVSGQDRRAAGAEMASILKVDPKTQPKPPENLNTAPVVPSNIETGSLVVLTVNDPNSPSKKMLQTYIAHGGGRLTPVALPTSFLNSVVTYMKKGTPKSTMSTASSPHLTSPSSVASHDSRTCSTPSGIQMNVSPAKRQRHSSYTITQL